MEGKRTNTIGARIRLGWAPVCILLAVHLCCYLLSQLVIRALNFPLHFTGTVIDDHIPLIPAFIIPYCLSGLCLIISYFLIVRRRIRRNRFSAAIVIGFLICLFAYILFPTGRLRPPAAAAGAWAPLFRLLYGMDAHFNSLPAMHCFLAWLCYAGVRGQKDISIHYRRFVFLAALAVFTSTAFIKQHYILDILSGMILAEISFALAGRPAIIMRADQAWAFVYRPPRATR